MHNDKPKPTEIGLGGFTALRVYFVDFPPSFPGQGWYWRVGRVHFGPFKTEAEAKRNALEELPKMFEAGLQTLYNLQRSRSRHEQRASTDRRGGR